MSFARFGINHLSPSSLNCWRETPGIWCLRYLARVRDEGAPAMWRGTAVERGLECLLRGAKDDALPFAMRAFEEAGALGEVRDDIENESALIPGMVAQCAKWLAALPPAPLAATQLKIETRLDGVSVPVIGYVDFTFMEGPDIDLKTTKQCPSKPRPDHVRQIALYNRARNRPGALLYVTDKRHAYYCPPQEELDEAIYELTDAARSLERFLSLMPDANTAIHCVPMTTDHYAFSSAYKQKLLELAEAF